MSRSQMLQAIYKAVQETPNWVRMTKTEQIGVFVYLVNKTLNK